MAYSFQGIILVTLFAVKLNASRNLSTGDIQHPVFCRSPRSSPSQSYRRLQGHRSSPGIMTVNIYFYPIAVQGATDPTDARSRQMLRRLPRTRNMRLIERPALETHLEPFPNWKRHRIGEYQRSQARNSSYQLPLYVMLPRAGHFPGHVVTPPAPDNALAASLSAASALVEVTPSQGEHLRHLVTARLVIQVGRDVQGTLSHRSEAVHTSTEHLEANLIPKQIQHKERQQRLDRS